MKAAIYARVSTDEQELRQQVEACQKFCEIKRWDYDIYTEKQSSTKERPVFNDVLSLCRTGGYSHLVVFRIDRAWRSSRQFIMDFDNLSARGVYIISVMESLDPTTPIGKAFMTILVALAELERENISMATQHRLRALKAVGKTLGRPKGSKDTKKRKNTGYIRNWDKKRGGRKPHVIHIENINENK